MTRWECRLAWISARANEPAQFRFSFTYPEHPKLAKDKPRQSIEHIITVDGTPAVEQADRLVRQLETTDPKTWPAR